MDTFIKDQLVYFCLVYFRTFFTEVLLSPRFTVTLHFQSNFRPSQVVVRVVAAIN